MSRVGRLSAIVAILLAALAIAWPADDPPPTTASAADGAQLFVAKGCASCHVGPDSNEPLHSGFPSLADADGWAGTRRPTMSAEAYLAESMGAPGAFISPVFFGDGGPTEMMPQLRLTAAEIDALVEYLLKPRT